jgi:hypothetical protein
VAVPGVSGASKPAVFQAAGFKDVNNNGVIEKKLWEEGYDEEADINLDGKIIKEEAKFYLWHLPKTSQEIKEKYPITKPDQAALLGLFNQALKTARALKDSWDRSYKISNVAREMADVGLFKEALEATALIDDLPTKWGTQRYIALKMAEAGLFEESAGVILPIKDSGVRSSALRELLKMMANAKLFRRTLELAPKVDDSWDKETVLRHVDSRMTAARISRTDINKMFYETGNKPLKK